MDFMLVLVLILGDVLVLTIFPSTICQAIQVQPTDSPTGSLDAKEAKEDLRRRRQHMRWKEPISFKPAPSDWPEPVLGVGDFIITDQSDSTSVSPLQAYQAKLQQELLKQEEARGLNNVVTEGPQGSSVWTSSEEDFKKLLDPDELLRHNKHLRPFVGRKGATDNVKSRNEQGKAARVTSLTALKAAVKNTRRKPRSTTDMPSRRGRKRKIIKEESKEGVSPKKEMKERKMQTNKETTVKKRKKQVRKFAFATQHSEEGENEIKSWKSKMPRTRKPKAAPSDEIKTTAYPIATSTLRSTTHPTTTYTLKATTSTSRLKSTTCPAAVSTLQSTEGRPKVTNTVESQTTQSTADASMTRSNTMAEVTTASDNFESVSTTERHTTTDKRSETKGKRKQMKQKMEEVIKAEQLEGSFGDKESDWTTSEKREILLSSVTEHTVLLVMLKDKIMSFVDNVLKKPPTSSTLQTKTHDRKFVKNTTDEI